MMLFASDLDGTLIYSRRFLENLQDKSTASLRLIETLKEKEISFTSEAIVKKLKMINVKMHFVPVTTRSIYQYNRIEIFREEIKPTYAIVSNGGNILVNGEPLMEWQAIIKERLKVIPLGIEMVLKKFSETEGSKWVISTNEVDNLFNYFILDQEKIVRQEMVPFFHWLRENQWTGSLQGRKLYLIPDCINKRDPILFLTKKLGIDGFVAAGDSFLDLPMLRAASGGIVPYHGELVESLGEALKKENIQYTTSKGVMGGEEILDFVLDFYKPILNSTFASG